MVALWLAKAGFGAVQDILRMPSDTVIMMTDYEIFLKKYEQAFYEINNENR